MFQPLESRGVLINHFPSTINHHHPLLPSTAMLQLPSTSTIYLLLLRLLASPCHRFLSVNYWRGGGAQAPAMIFLHRAEAGTQIAGNLSILEAVPNLEAADPARHHTVSSCGSMVGPWYTKNVSPANVDGFWWWIWSDEGIVMVFGAWRGTDWVSSNQRIMASSIFSHACGWQMSACAWDT